MEKQKKQKEREALSERDNLYLEKMFKMSVSPGSISEDEDKPWNNEEIFETFEPTIAPPRESTVGSGAFNMDVVKDAVQLLSVSRPKTGGKQLRKLHHPMQAPHKQPRQIASNKLLSAAECKKCTELEKEVESLKRQLQEASSKSK